jgi:hypothetical protein
MIDVINLSVLFVLGILYLFTFTKVQQRYFSRYGSVNRPISVTLLLMASVGSAAVNLIHIADLAANSNRFFMSSGDYMKAFLFSFCFFAVMWVLSLAIFHISFLVTGSLTKENEYDELMKNNIELSLLHSVILLSISFIISPPLIKIASTFIPYPELPF